MPAKLGGLSPEALRWALHSFLIDALRYYGGAMERDEAERAAAVALLLRVDTYARAIEHSSRCRGQKRLYSVISHIRGNH